MGNQTATGQDQHPFLVWISQVEKGRFIDDAWEALREVVGATANTKKPSTLSLSFSISRYDLDDDEDYRRDVQPSISTRTHVPKRGHTTMYVTPDQGLARYDPRQARLEFVMPATRPEPQPVPVAQRQESEDE